MIFTERQITVRKGKSCIDEPVILYRGDYEVSIKFTIMEFKFRFKDGVNLVDTEKASYGQLAILAPYGGNVFSEVVECEDGTITFALTKEMIDQLEEVGLYSFQIRLFDYDRESRVSIPPVEFGIEVREPVASEDHDNEVNNAIVGYSIAKVVDGLNEDIPNIFDADGQYNEMNWKTGDRITEGKLNRIENAIYKVNQNEKLDIATLDKRITNNYNVLDSNKVDKFDYDSKIWSMANMGQDVKEAMTGGSVAVVGKNAILTENISDYQVTLNKMGAGAVDGRVLPEEFFAYDTHFANTSFSSIGENNVHIYLITIPNVFNRDLVVGDIVTVSFSAKCKCDSEVQIVNIGLGTTNFTDNTSYILSRVPDYVYTAFSNRPTITDEFVNLSMPVSITTNFTEKSPYLIVSMAIGTNNNKTFDVTITNIKVELDGSTLEPEVIYAGVFKEGDTSSVNKRLYGSPIKGVISSSKGIDADRITDNSISIDKLSPGTMTPKYVIDGSAKINAGTVTYGSWFLFTIADYDLYIDNGAVSFEAYLNLSSNAYINTTDGVCAGYTKYLDETEYVRTLQGYTLYAKVSPEYDSDTNIVKVKIPYLPTSVDGYNHLVIGIRVKTVEMDENISNYPFEYSYIVENIPDKANSLSFAGTYGARVELTYTKRLYNSKTMLITNNNADILLNLNNQLSTSGKYISILGDSISTYAGWIPEGNAVWYTGSTSDVTSVTQTWWHQAITELNAELCVNNSWSGSRVSTTGVAGSAGCDTRCVNLHTDEHDPDIIIVYLGINDFNSGVDIGTYDGTDLVPTDTETFREAYGVMLDKILTRYQDARLYVCTLPYCDRNENENAFPEKNQNNVPLSKFNDAIRELANAFGVEIIELSKCGITFHNRKKYLTDELHPLQIGMDLITRKVVNTIKDL